MSRKYLSINQVDNEVQGWTVLVQVVERNHIMIGKKNNSPYRRYVVTDDEGTLVSVVTFGNHINYFAKKLLPFKRYYISNATVKPVDPMYRVGSYAYSWTLYSSNLVDLLDEPIPPHLPCHFELTRFQQLFKHAETERLQNVMGVIVHAFPEKKKGDSTIREFVIVNEEKRLMLLTLWNEYLTEEGTMLAEGLEDSNVIIAMRVRVTTFNGLSLSTKKGSCILVNPPMPETASLKQWHKDNYQFVEDSIRSCAYKDPGILLPPPMDVDILKIDTAISALINENTAWIKGTLKIPNNRRSLWYSACGNCHKSVAAPLDWNITCPSCMQESIVQPRYRLEITICNETTSMNAFLYGKDAEKFIPFTIDQLQSAEHQGQMIKIYAQVATAVQEKEVVCFVRHYNTDFSGVGATSQGSSSGNTDRYTVVKLYTVEEISHQNSAHFTSPIQEGKTSSTITSGGACSSQTTYSSSPDKQFFSPTCGKLLEAIAEQGQEKAKSETSKTATKRSLVFTNDVMETDQQKDTSSTVQTKQLPGSPSKINQGPVLHKKPRDKVD